MFHWRRNKGREEQPLHGHGPSTPDAELVVATRGGDKRAFVEIVSRHQAMVCGIALGILGDFGASEDAAQESFLTAWRKFHDLREPDRLRPWLAQIARNTALGHLRRTRDHDPLDDALAVVDASPTPDEAAVTDDEAALVSESLARLPETYRLPLILFYREGQSVSDVAEALSISEDAAKQRLARGREMLRDRMTGMVERVLTRTRPTAVFTMTIAVAIGALAAPAVIAGTVFAASAAGTTAAASTSTSLLTAMSTSKTSLVAAACIAAVSIPVGYHLAAPKVPESGAQQPAPTTEEARIESTNRGPAYLDGALFAEWRRLHEVHGTNAAAMPEIYKAIAEMKDATRRRAFRAALIAEWVQLDGAGGMRFFRDRSNESSQRRHFFAEWLARDATNAVASLMASGPGWESIARDSLKEIATHLPSKIPEIVAKLPKPDSYWDTRVRDAFAIVAGTHLQSARTAAESLTGPNREQALAGVAQAWAKSDLQAAIAWAKELPNGVDRDEIIRGALLGKAASDPVAALEMSGMVPPGGRSGYFATTTGARILSAAARADYDATVAWLARNPSRMGHEDLMGLAQSVTDRMNADPVGFLNRHTSDGSLNAIMPAVNSALLNEAGGQREAIWEWLKTQPENDATATLRRDVLSTAGYQDPALAMKLVKDLPATAEGDQQVRSLAMSLWNGGQYLGRFDKLMQEAPERIRPELVRSAFEMLRGDNIADPEVWAGRVSMLPEASRAQGAQSVARAWSDRAPEQAAAWAATLPAGAERNSAYSAVAAGWASADITSAATWVSTMPAGIERDRSAQGLAGAMAAKHPTHALEWALSISDPGIRMGAAMEVVQRVANEQPAAARQLIESPHVPPDMRTQLEASMQRLQRTPQRTQL